MFGESEVVDSIKKHFKNRLTSPIYGVFLISWIIFHWQFVVTLFFVGEDKIWQATGLLKNDYLVKVFFDFQDWEFYFWMLMPFITTYLVIWKIPKWIAIPAFKKEIEDKTEKRRLELLEERKLDEEFVKNLNVITEKTQIEKEIKQQEKEIQEIDPSEKWEQEYKEFERSNLFGSFRLIIESVYSHNGSKSWYLSAGMTQFTVPQNIIVYADTNGIIKLNSDKNKDKMELTEKGRYFVRRYSSQN